MLEELRKKCALYQGQRNGLESELHDLEALVRQDQEKVAKLSRVKIVLKKLVDTATQKDLQKIQDFVTNGTKKVMWDNPVECCISAVSKTGASQVRIYGKQGSVEGPYLTTFGGGVWNTVSFLLRVIFILRFGMRRVLFLDESFCKLSEEYQPYMSELIQNLSSQLGFKILLITQRREFAEYADRVYEAKLSKGELKIERVEKK